MAEKKDTLLQRRFRKMEKIKKNLDFIKGSISKVSRENKAAGEFYHLTYKDEKQKTHTKYIPANLVKEVKKGIRKMEQVRKIINEISIINIELLKRR
jgi:adenine-specific DNA methylase